MGTVPSQTTDGSAAATGTSSTRQQKWLPKAFRHSSPEPDIDIDPSKIPSQPLVVDLGYGAVCDRSAMHESQQSGHTGKKERFFYHARINDIGDVQPEEEFKKHYVIKGPPRDGRRKLHIVLAAGEQALVPAPSGHTQHPLGRGYQWPSSYQPSDMHCFELAIPDGDEDLQTAEGDVTILDSVDDVIRLSICDTDTVANLKEQLSVHLVVPADKIAIFCNGTPLQDSIVVATKRDSSKVWQQFVIELREL